MKTCTPQKDYSLTRSKVEQANICADKSYWWLKKIPSQDMERLGILDKVTEVLNLLRTVDHITIDIMITIDKINK